ncbi:MAG TPA: hypothetical protein VG860_08555 [Terriglobia bacterium]|jgi:hypothetical protein|nr:hypothetical protein [Terriglobia bacterium]
MKRVLSTLSMAAVTLVALGFLAVGQLRADTWTGWISDSGCGAKGASASHKACAVKCIKGGGKYVFVNSATKDVTPIHNQDAVSADNIGMEVTVSGTLTDSKELHVDSITPAKSSN